MKARIHIFYKDSVFDPAGNTLAESLRRQGFQRVSNVRVGKVVDVDLGTASADETKAEAQKMCEGMLVNPVIEAYHIELLTR